MTLRGSGQEKKRGRQANISGGRQTCPGARFGGGACSEGDSGWFVPFYLDVGTGPSTVTWQGLLGIG